MGQEATLNRYVCNVEQSICILFYVLAQFLFTTSETELAYYQQKVNVVVALSRLRILGSYKISR